MTTGLKILRRKDLLDSPSLDDLAERPLILGRLERRPGVGVTLMGHTGDIRSLPDDWYEPIAAMDGFRGFEDIAAETGRAEAAIRQIHAELAGEKRLGLVGEWNVTSWCGACALYLSRASLCPECGEPPAAVPLLPPCDPWILFGVEHEFVAGILRDRLGVEVPPERLLLGNNGLRNGRFFWQIVCDGRVVMHISFAGRSPDDWRISLTDDAERVDWPGSGRAVNDEIMRHAAANRQSLDALVDDSLAFLSVVTGFMPTDPLLYFSGGKESVVMLDLLERAGQRANLAFVGTGVDFPEDRDFLLDELKPYLDEHDLFDLRVNLGAEQDFLGHLDDVGHLDARTPWCRERVKAPLKAAITDELYGADHFVALEGSRWYENDFRRSHPRVNFATGYDRQIWVHPVAPWTGLDVWLHIHRAGLPVNPMYHLGYQRTTCWICPIVNPFHFHTSRTQYPDLWAKVDAAQLRGFDDGDNRNTPF